MVALCQVPGEQSGKILSMALGRKGIDSLVEQAPHGSCAPLTVRVPVDRLDQARRVLRDL